MAFHGIDLHSDSLLAATMRFEDGIETGIPIKTAKYYLKGDSFQKFKDSLTENDYVIIEASPNAFWLYDEIINLVKNCYILNANKFRQNINKTDKIDAKMLVKRLAYYVIAGGDKNDLPTVYVPSKEVQELRGLFSTYKLGKKAINQYKNRIHSILKQNGLFIAKKKVFSRGFRTELVKLPISDNWRFQIKTLLNQLDSIEEQTKEIKKVIFNSGYSLFKKEVELLLSITGFSAFTAIALMSDVVDVNRFSSVKKFCAYLRTAPKVKSSNQTTRIGKVNKQGRSLSCTLMTQSIVHFSKAGPYLELFYGRVKVGKKAGVYRMALIRKILVCAYYILKRDKKFHWIKDDLYNRKLKDLKRQIDKFQSTNTEKKEVQKKIA